MKIAVHYCPPLSVLCGFKQVLKYPGGDESGGNAEENQAASAEWRGRSAPIGQKGKGV